MDTTPRPTTSALELLQRWRNGDSDALRELLAAVQPDLHESISKSLGNRPRGIQDSLDIAHDAIVNFLRWGPRYVPETEAQFRALLKKIAVNQVVDQQRRQGRRKQVGHLESMRMGSATHTGFSPPMPSAAGPSALAQRKEEQEWVNLALQFLTEEERFLLVASEVENADWASIAEELGLNSADTARMRCARLKPKLARLLLELRSGRMPKDSAS